MMVSKRRLSAEFAQNISNWSHSGFHVHCGPPVEADQPQALERLAAYILRPSFASTRVRYLAGSGAGPIPDRQRRGSIYGRLGLDCPGGLPHPRSG